MPTLPPRVARYVEPVVVSCVVEALPLNCCSCDHVLFVVVPNASENVLSAVRSPPPSSGYVVLIVLAFVTGVKPKIEEEAVMFSVPLPFDV